MSKESKKGTKEASSEKKANNVAKGTSNSTATSNNNNNNNMTKAESNDPKKKYEKSLKSLHQLLQADAEDDLNNEELERVIQFANDGLTL
jgi:hypothetical protein